MWARRLGIELGTLLASLMKWTGVGAGAGVGAVIFRYLILWFTLLFGGHEDYSGVGHAAHACCRRWGPGSWCWRRWWGAGPLVDRFAHAPECGSGSECEWRLQTLRALERARRSCAPISLKRSEHSWTPPLLGRREELQFMAVEIEIEGRVRYPAMGDWASGRHATFAEDSGSPFEIRLVHCESKVVVWELTVVLLKHDHPGRTRDSEEQPLSPIVPKADR